MSELRKSGLRRMTSGRILAMILSATLVAATALWGAASVHALEHAAQHDSSPCDTCIAVSATDADCSQSPALVPDQDARPIEPGAITRSESLRRAQNVVARAPPLPRT